MAKFCANCGSPLDGAGKFCPSCGAQVMEEAVQATENPQSNRQEMKNSPMQRQTMQLSQPQPAMYQNAPGQCVPNAAYGMGMMGAQAFNGEHYVPDEGIQEMFFRYDNRLNRKRYIMRGLAIGVAVMVAALVVGVILAMADVSESTIGTIGTLIGFGGGIAGLMLGIRRLHDLDRPTWWIAGHFIPFVNVALALYLLFAEGTYGPNQYGPDPLEGRH